MPKGYWLVQTDITDPERHAEYVKKNRPVFGRYGARILVRWGQHEVVEGVARSRQVMFEFPDYESALACYHDPAYEAAHQLRVGAANGDVVIVEGYDGPQPVADGGEELAIDRFTRIVRRQLTRLRSTLSPAATQQSYIPTQGAVMPAKHSDLTPSNTAIVLIDHQPGVLAMVNSVPTEQLTANVAILARLGEETAIPLLVTSTRENIEFLGTTIEAIQQAAPVAYENRIRRAGTLNAFLDEAFVAAVKALDRPNLVIAGVLTDVCLWHSAVSAVEAGYNVQVVADASGTTSQLADDVTYSRLRDLGVVVGTTFGTLFELFPDLSTPEGAQAEVIASGMPLAV